MNISKPAALVTGASRGIGAAIARQLASDGFHVIVNFSSSEARARETVQAIEAAGGSAGCMGFDVSNPEQVQEKFELIAKSGHKLAVLVNNAGINIDGLLIRMKNADLDRTLDVDLKGAIYCTRAAARLMMKERVGSIIHVSSVVGESGNAGQSAYSAAKAGLIGFSKSIARELSGRNIRVNVIAPGFIETDMTQALTGEQKEAILRNVPLGCFGTPDDVAGLASFLASPRSRYITGQVVGVNGGLYM